MRSLSLQTTEENLDADLEKWRNENVQLLLLFTSTANLRDQDVAGRIKRALPDAHLIGCSTSGEIGTHIEDDSISLLGLSFEKSHFKCVAVPVEGADGSRSAGQDIGRQLNAEDLAGVFVLMPGVNVNGSKFTLGLKEVLPPHVSISGGLAGDGLRFKETLTVFEGEAFANRAVGFGLYGKDIKILSGSRGGWKPFGPQRRVTKAENNILYELDGKPALDLYKEYLGEKAVDLPSSDLLYPFAIMDSENPDSAGLIRTILDIDEDRKSLVLAGDIDNGQLVCLMHANTEELVGGAEDAAKQARGDCAGTDSDAVICVSCVGRKIVMGADTEDELDAVRDVFENKNIAGFYSYGEICIYQDTGEPELHNQTMTVTYITEKTA